MKRLQNPNIAEHGKRTRFTSETAPKGRKNAGLSVNEWRNQLAEYSGSEIEAVLEDPSSPACKVIAAKEVLQAMGGDKDARRDLCDYTGNKPASTQHNLNEDVTYIKRIIKSEPSRN